MDGHVVRLAWWRNVVELLALSFDLGALVGAGLLRGRSRKRVTMAALKQKNEQECRGEVADIHDDRITRVRRNGYAVRMQSAKVGAEECG
jgi:hypothetical protein